jgi:hypothetical protein
MIQIQNDSALGLGQGSVLNSLGMKLAFQLEVGPRRLINLMVRNSAEEDLLRAFWCSDCAIGESFFYDLFFGSSNAVRNMRNDFPTRPRRPTSKAKKYLELT